MAIGWQADIKCHLFVRRISGLVETRGIEDTVLVLKVEMPLSGQGKEELPT